MPVLIPNLYEEQAQRSAEIVEALAHAMEEMVEQQARFEQRIQALAGFCAAMAEDVEALKLLGTTSQHAVEEQGDIVMQDEEPSPLEEMRELNTSELAQALIHQMSARGIRIQKMQMEDDFICMHFQNRDDEKRGQELIEKVMDLWQRFYNCENLTLATRTTEEEEVANPSPPSTQPVISLADFKANMGI